jgi:hypothetical protein
MLGSAVVGLTCEWHTVLRIRDVYSGSRILIFTHPGSRIQTKEKGEKKFVAISFFVATDFTQLIPDPGPGVKKALDTGSATLVAQLPFYSVFFFSQFCILTITPSLPRFTTTTRVADPYFFIQYRYPDPDHHF